jgi:hypothetical protein
MAENQQGKKSTPASLAVDLASLASALQAAETALREGRLVDLTPLQRQIADICQLLATMDRHAARAHLQGAETVMCALDQLEAAARFKFAAIGSAADETAAKAETARRAYAGVTTPTTRSPLRER